jgi:hypothetical protein
MDVIADIGDTLEKQRINILGSSATPSTPHHGEGVERIYVD